MRLRLVATLMGNLLLPPIAFSQEMTTLERYMQQNDFSRNPGAAEHVFLRCASLMLLVGGYLQQRPDLQAMGKNFAESGQRYLNLIQQSPSFNQQFALDQIKRMTEAYRERWLKSVALTGSFSDDSVLRSDIKACSAVISQQKN